MAVMAPVSSRLYRSAEGEGELFSFTWLRLGGAYLHHLSH